MKPVPSWFSAAQHSAGLSAVLAVLVLAIILSACSPVSPSTETSITSLPAGAILFQDDFSNANSGWGEWEEDGAQVKYNQGGLRILVNQPQFDYWSVAGRKFSDVQIEVDARLIGKETDNDYGVICRYQDQGNFYMLVISSDGYFGIAKMKDGAYSMIGADQLQYSTAIAQGNSTNHLRADCVGQTLTLYANDQKLMQATDDEYLSGDVGLLAGAYDRGDVDILFDNFVVKKP
jgi:hypothetical protein